MRRFSDLEMPLAELTLCATTRHTRILTVIANPNLIYLDEPLPWR